MFAPKKYKITAIVSVYNAEEFLRDCLEDLVRQTLFEQTEVLIIDACSPQNEKAIALEFTEKYPNILYMRTKERETLYASWNRGIKMARGEYITNANADDRHAPNAFERLAAELDTHPDVGLVYAKYRITAQKNANFATAPIKRYLQWYDYDHFNLLRRTEVGPQPMWRKSVHARVGFFDADFSVGGDYDMWLRISERYPLLYLPEELGLCLEYDNNIVGQNPARSYDECYEAKKRALRRFLHPKFTLHTSLTEQFNYFGAQVAESIKNIQQGKSIEDVDNLERIFFSYGVLAARVVGVQSALEVLTLFFSLVAYSANICHLYRFLLLDVQSSRPQSIDSPEEPEEPLVSIVMPLQKHDEYIEDAVLSILAQSQTRWELRILCENDATLLQRIQRFLAKYSDPRIKITPHTLKNKGEIINSAIHSCSASHLCIVHAHDLLAPSYLHTALILLEENADVGWICPQSLVIGAENHIAYKENYNFFHSLIQCPCPPTSIYKRKIWEELDGYAENMQGCEGWDFWLRAGEQGWSGFTTPTVQCVYRSMPSVYGESIEEQHRAKTNFITKHAHWFLLNAAEELQNEHFMSATNALPAKLLDRTAIDKVRIHYGNKEAFINAIEQLKRENKR